MTAIAITAFAGENRALEPKLLPEGQGVLSRNQKPGRGDLRGWREPLQVMLTPSQTQRQTIYRMGRDSASDTTYWLSWTSVVHVARGFDVEDASERTLYTGDGYPKVTDNLALSAASPTLNPTVHRPLGLPAPTTAPSLTVSSGEVDPDVGKYRIGYPDANIRAVVPGFRCVVRVKGLPAQPVTVAAGSGGDVTPESFAAQFDALDGLRAYVADSDDDQIPGGVWVIGESVGVTWDVVSVSGTKTNYDPDATTLSPLLSAVGGASGAGGGATLYSVQAVTTASYSLFVPEASLATLAAGDTLTGLVAGAQRWSVKLTGNSKASIVAALTAAGVSSSDQVYVPPSSNGGAEGDGSGSYGQASGIWIVMGATTAAQTITLTRNPPKAAALVVGKAWLAANAAPGDKWQVAVNSAAPVLVTLTAGSGTYPPAVTATSLKGALAPVSGLKLTDEVDAGGAPQLRIEATDAGATSAITIKKIIPTTSDVYSEPLVATLYAAKKREVFEYYYVYTYVNDWGWESAPSPVSDAVERTVKESTVISNIAAPPSGNNYNINRIRVYRTQAGTSGNADFFFLLEAAITAATVTDDGRDVAEVLTTKNWITAPGVPRGGADNHTEPNLSCLTPMWNGMLAGIVGRSVRFCEAYTPYAWPIEYDAVPPDGTPVALGVFGQNLLVLTTGRPLLVYGSSPESLDQAPQEVPQGCIAPRSVVSMGNGVAWASNDGLCWYGEGGARILTAGVMTREDWLALRPQTIIGQMYEGLYYGSYEPAPGQPRQGFMVSPAGGGVFFMDEGFDAAYFDSLQDQLYVLRGNRILKWEAGASWMGARFRSKVCRQTRPVNFACAEVVASGYPVTLRVDAVGLPQDVVATRVAARPEIMSAPAPDVLRFTKTVPSREPFRLPAGFQAMDWQVEVATPAGAAEVGVQAVLLATTMKELAQL